MNLNLIHRFGRDRRGNVAIIFAFSIIPLLLLAGGGIDFGQATRIKAELQEANDVAALAVARDGLALTDAQLPATAKRYIDANFHRQTNYVIDKVTLDRATMTAEVDSHVDVPTTFLKMMSMSIIPVSVQSVTKGLGFEIALVLDTSGSMTAAAGSGGSKINALKDATKALFDILYGDQMASNRFSMGIVPFASSVNVGPGYANSAWMDSGANPSNPDHDEDFDTTKSGPLNRFNLFSGVNGMRNVSWAGCVMTRRPPYDIDDTPATGGYTQFVPWFAPDEPDYGEADSGNMYANSYLNDEGGGCTYAGGDTNSNVADTVKQKRVCKYKGVTPDTSNGRGPNYLCTSQPITPLVSQRATLDSAVAALNASGNTNVLEGFMWGWRILSPTEPFAQGKAYSAPNNRKVMIVMTDGENNYGGRPYTFNYSEFFSYGYARTGHLLNSNNNNSLDAALDARTKLACANAKAKGIIVYAIAFGADAAQDLLKYCATDAAHFYAPQNSSDLTPTFVAIAQSINALRIAE